MTMNEQFEKKYMRYQEEDNKRKKYETIQKEEWYSSDKARNISSVITCVLDHTDFIYNLSHSTHSSSLIMKK